MDCDSGVYVTFPMLGAAAEPIGNILHHHAVFPLCRSVLAKSPKKASNGLYFMITGDQRPHHSAANPRSRCRSEVSQCSKAGCVHVKMEYRSYAACRGKDLSCSATRATGCTFFFPRVRTPCGHGAQASLKGGRKSLMVEKRTRTPNTTQTKQLKAHRPSPPSCSLSSVLGETGETKTSDQQWA